MAEDLTRTFDLGKAPVTGFGPAIWGTLAFAAYGAAGVVYGFMGKDSPRWGTIAGGGFLLLVFGGLAARLLRRLGSDRRRHRELVARGVFVRAVVHDVRKSVDVDGDVTWFVDLVHRDVEGRRHSFSFSTSLQAPVVKPDDPVSVCYEALDPSNYRIDEDALRRAP